VGEEREPEDWRAGGFGVYVHWPFCAAKCPYCDFNSHVAHRPVDQARWRRGLLRELRAARAMTGARPAETVFFGGGTPSLMPVATVAAVIEEIDRLWGLVPGAEITLEANPTSVEAKRFGGYAQAGVNRISMGVQALRDDDLKALGRMHGVAEAQAGFMVARNHFDRVSFDLIYARTGQTVETWLAELDEAIGMAIDHLSLYQLTIEPGTRFAELHARGRLRVPDDDVSADMFEATQTACAAAGLPAYEVSNHARPGAESRHNLIYWRYGDYAGVGPGAHGRITRDGQRLATETLRQPSAWLDRVEQGGDTFETAPLSGLDQATEYLLMAMRLAEGADTARFRRLAGYALPEDRVAALIAQGLLMRRQDRITTTSAGRPLLDAILRSLLDA
jgi:oxygen-independent coproporphyrinogen-3 oxidase